FAHAGSRHEGRSGLVFDMSARIDGQAHADYATRMFGRQLRPHPRAPFSAEGFFDPERAVGDYLHVFDRVGRPVTQGELGFDAWHDWQVELAARLELTIDFFYANFVRGARRVVIDGIEPARGAGESIQLELFEYIYEQILRKEADWVARDLFRQSF